MRTLFIILMILLVLAIAVVALLNNEIVTVNYLLGQVDLTLFAVILGSTFAGILIMVFFGIYRSIHNYVKSESERNLKKELHRRVKLLEDEKKKLEDELDKLQKEREKAAAQQHAELEAEKEKLEDELNRQRKERADATKGQAELEAEKEKLEDELNRQRKERGGSDAQDDTAKPQKKGFWGFLKR